MNKRVACVHGRFQPLHLGHEEYILEALKHSSHLYIGITQIYPRHLESNQKMHRYSRENNPLSFFQRVRCVEAFINEHGLTNCTPIPFPIEQPDELLNFISKDVLCVTTIMDEWNIKKIEILEEMGFDVLSLWDRRELARPYSGTSIRSQCRVKGIESVRNQVSPGVYGMLVESGFEQLV